MQLTNRLYMNITICQPCNVLADVGCDHAYTDIYAIENGIAKKAVAMDLRKGPLEKAKSNIKEAGLEDKIDTRLGNGLEALEEGEADAVLISGMGGITICNILNEGSCKLDSVGQLVLQPQSDLDLVRKKLEELNYYISDEKMCKEDGKYYTCIRAIKANALSDKYLYELEDEYPEYIYHYGYLLIKEKNELLHEYLLSRIEKIEMIKKQILSAGVSTAVPEHIIIEETNINSALAMMK